MTIPEKNVELTDRQMDRKTDRQTDRQADNGDLLDKVENGCYYKIVKN